MNNTATKIVLVTGGAGYVGSHACKVLAKEGYQPIAFDNLSSGHAWAAKWGPLERGTSSIGLLLIAPLRSTAQAPACTLPLLPVLENRFQIPENTIVTTSPAF
jgi:nucleoside-diphosphate-sugar epimerase